MKLNKTYIFILILIGILHQSCERDEICIDEITPHLVIRLYDKNNPTELKKINKVTIKIMAIDSTIVFQALDSILIPLNITNDNTQYQLTIENNDTTLNDNITVSYSSEDIFVGRSCGYKTVFNTVKYKLESQNWIDHIESISSKIENENNAHVKIFF